MALALSKGSTIYLFPYLIVRAKDQKFKKLNPRKAIKIKKWESSLLLLQFKNQRNPGDSQ